MSSIIFELCNDLEKISLKKTKKMRVLFFGRDSFSDNSKYLFLFMLKKYKNIDIQWCSIDINIIDLLTKNRLPCYDLNRDIHLTLDFLLESSIAIFCVNPLESLGHNLPMLSALRGALTFQMWHGIGPKQADLALTSVKNMTDINTTKLMLGATFPEYYISSSAFIDKKWHDFFGAKKIIRASFPRNELLLREPSALELLGSELDKKVFNALYQNENKKILLAPTWEENAGLNNINLLSKIVVFCQENNINVFIKKHPFIKNTSDLNREIKNLHDIPSHLDIYPHLNNFDAIITDYSSIIYDFLLTGKPVCTTDISKGEDFDFNLIPGEDGYRYKISEHNTEITLNNMLSNDTKIIERKNLGDILFGEYTANACYHLSEKIFEIYKNNSNNNKQSII